MPTLIMFVLSLSLQMVASHPKEPINKNISTNLHKNDSRDKTDNKTLYAVADNAPNKQKDPTADASENKNYPSSVTYRVETAPQTEGRWFKGYVLATFVIALFNLGTIAFVWQQLSVMRLEQRAWVFIGPPHLETISDKVEIKIRIGNAGRTPAKAVVRFIDIAWAERGSMPIFNFTEPTGANAVVFPGRSVYAYTEKPCPNDIHLKINSGEFFIWVYGTIAYKDVFKRKHWTKFCFILDTVSKQRFRAHTEHNETDD